MVYALPVVPAAMGITAILLVFLVAMPLLTGTPATLRLYERAVVWTRGEMEAVLLLDQVKSLTAVHVPQAHADGTVRPQLRLQFAAASSVDQNIEFATSITPENRERLEAIVIQSATVLAASMRQTLQADGQVAWTDQLTIADNEIICSLEGNGARQRIQRSDIQGWSLSDTKLMMVLPTGQTISLPSSCANFYPGLVLLRELGWFKSTNA